MRYVKAYSILETEDNRDIKEIMESIERCLEQEGEQYGIRGAKVTAVSKSTREEFNE